MCCTYIAYCWECCEQGCEYCEHCCEYCEKGCAYCEQGCDNCEQGCKYCEQGSGIICTVVQRVCWIYNIVSNVLRVVNIASYDSTNL